MSSIPQIYFDSISKFPLLTADQEIELAERVSQGDFEARERLTESNLRLVISIAHRYKKKGIDFDDLVSEGNIGLMRAVEGYTPQPGSRFAAYASQWIMSSIRKLVVSNGSIVRVGMSRKKIAKWNEAKAILDARLGREPTTEEIGKHLGLSRRQGKLIVQAIRVMNTPIENELFNSDGQPGNNSVIEDPNSAPPDVIAEQADLIARLPGYMGLLDQRELTVIRMSYGLDGHASLNDKQIGLVLDINRITVSTIRKRALAKLAA